MDRNPLHSLPLLFSAQNFFSSLMADIPSINAVETDEDYIHVQFRDPDQFDNVRTLDWAENPAHAVSDRSEVRTGQRREQR